MALTNDQVAFLRARLGSGFDEDDAEERLIRLGGEGFEAAVVVEVLQERLSTLATKPDTFTVVGEYSESWGKSIALVQQQLVDAAEEAAGLGVGIATVVIQQPERSEETSVSLDTEEMFARGRLSGGR